MGWRRIRLSGLLFTAETLRLMSASAPSPTLRCHLYRANGGEEV